MELTSRPAVELLTPPSLPKPLERYSHLSVVRPGELVSVAGQVSVDDEGNFVGVGDVLAQTHQAFNNVRRALQTVALDVGDIWKLNAYVVGAGAIEQFMQGRTEVYEAFYPDGAYPPITLVQVVRLAYPELLVEVEAIAVRPEAAGA